MSDPPEDTNDGHPSHAADGSDGCPSHEDADAASRCIIFLDIDGVLNTTKHNKQIHLETPYLKRLKTIVEATDALIVLTTFWRHFHEYISYVLHRHGIDVARHTLPLPMGATAGKQCTKKFLHFHRVRQRVNGYHDGVEEESNAMIGRSANDEAEYASRAEEIEAWLQTYGERYMGSEESNSSEGANREAINGSAKGEYDFHRERWRYCILDDRPTAAKPGTPVFERFVLTETKLGLTEEDAKRAIKLLRFGP